MILGERNREKRYGRIFYAYCRKQESRGRSAGAPFKFLILFI